MAKLLSDEYAERLFLGDEELFSEDGDIFDLLASDVADLLLSDIPPGIRVQLCDRVLGSSGDLNTRLPYAVFENSSEHGLIAHMSTPIIHPEGHKPGSLLRDFFMKSLEAGEHVLAPLAEAGRLIRIKRSSYEDIAFLNYTITLFDQTIIHAEAFVSEINDRVAGTYEPPKLFICHASEDKQFVDQLVHELDRRAMFAWYDKREIFVGDSIVERINAALRSSDYLVAVLSPRSVVKPWVVREMSSSLMRQLSDNGIRVLPVLLEPCDVPSLISDIKYADFCDSFERGIDDLMEAIRSRTST